MRICGGEAPADALNASVRPYPLSSRKNACVDGRAVIG